MTNDERQAGSHHVTSALLVAGLLLAAVAALSLLSPGFIGDDVARRATGVLLGAVVVWYANAAPKTLTPLARLRSPAAEQAMRRFTGWALTLGGVGYALTWVLAPLAHAWLLAIALLGAAVLVVLARWTLAAARRPRG